jgi:mannose-6-phosphate isomerase-like protein (cupin superfamily)
MSREVLHVLGDTAVVESSDEHHAVLSMTMAPRYAGPPMHIHDDCEEVFVCRAGEMVTVVGDERRHLKAGDMVVVPRGRPHSYFNPLDEPCLFACIIFNRHLLDLFRDIDALTKQGTAAPDPQALVAALERNQVGFAGPPVGPG